MVLTRDIHENVCIRARRVPSCFHVMAAMFIVLASFLLMQSRGFAGNLDKVVLFNIDAQALDRALLQFGAQAHVQISFAWDSSTAKRRTLGLKGNYIARQALTELLKGTRLTYVAHEQTVEILPQALADPSPSTQPSRSGRHTDPLPLSGGGKPGSLDPTVNRWEPKDARSTQALAEIIVSAQKYQQRAFDVPISLQVVDGEALLQHGITDLSNLQYDVPGLYMNNAGTTHAVYLRGVGNSLGTGAMVGQYIDEADMTAETYYSGTEGYATNDGGLYDLQRVEVLKGPQGTLYGDGSMGGVIRYITNEPVLDRFQMSAYGAALYTENGGLSQRIETMLNTPLIDGTLGVRFAGMFEHDGGWVDEPVANLKNINGGNLADMRAEALWRPTTRFKLNVMQIIHRHTSGIGAGEDASGGFTPLLGTTYVPNVSDRSDLSNITITYDFGATQLLSSSTYLNGQQNQYNLYAETAVPPNPTFFFLEPFIHVNNEASSEELRLANTGSELWHWSIGGFYKDYHDKYSYPGEYYGIAGAPSAVSLASALQSPGAAAQSSSRSVAGFADTSYLLFSRLTLGAGVRYFKDHETDLSTTESGYLSTTKPHVNVTTPFTPGNFTSTDPRFYIQYAVTSHINTYASAAKGFRSGGFNLTPSEPPYQPEVLWSYDLGLKLRFPTEGVRADVDGFVMNYSNYVSTTYVPPVYLLANVGKARIQGVDAALTLQPLRHWKLSLNTEFLRSQFLTASAISGYAPGQRLPFAPTYSFAASIQREFRWRGKDSNVELYYYEISRVQYRLAHVPQFQSDILHFLSFRADILWNDNLSLGLFAHNLLNDRGYESPLYYTDTSARPRPRTFGIEFDVRFGR